MIATATQDYQITWEKLPDDYVLPDEPVDNINQPPLIALATHTYPILSSLNKLKVGHYENFDS